MTSEDIRVNYQRQIEAKDATGADDGTYLSAGAFRRTASMDVPDDETWIARTDGPDATWLGVPLRPFSWITSPKRSRNSATAGATKPATSNCPAAPARSSPTAMTPDIGISMSRNPNYWKMGVDGQPLPYYDEVTLSNMEDPTTVDAAYRSKEILNGALPADHPASRRHRRRLPRPQLRTNRLRLHDHHAGQLQRRLAR